MLKPVNESADLVVRIYGPFHVKTLDGLDITPKGRKARAVLGILVLSQDHEKSRLWLQRCLWGDRGESQAASSLRQCLAEIRRGFSKYADVLSSTNGIVSLDGSRFDIEKRDPEAVRYDLLEGLDLPEKPFQEWLHQQRDHHSKPKASLLRQSTEVGGCSASDLEQIKPFKPKLFVAKSPQGTSVNQIVRAGMAGYIGQLLSETGCVDVHRLDEEDIGNFEYRNSPAVLLSADVQEGGALVHLCLEDAQTKKQIWSRLIGMDSPDNQPNSLHDLQASVNVAAQSALDWMVKQTTAEGTCASHYARGVQLTQRHRLKDYWAADECFKTAYDMEPNGVYLAWRAYIRSFIVAELMPHERDTISEEVSSLTAKALEMDSQNSLVLSLCAHVQSTVFLAFDAAYELAVQSMAINNTNPLALVSLATAQSHIGQLDDAIDNCRRARAIAGTSPFRAHVDLLSCIVAVVSGNYAEARRYGEAAHAATPTLAAPLRFLLPLYTEAQRDESAAQTLAKLCAMERGFTPAHLRDLDYPCESLRKSNLINYVSAN